MAQTSLPVVITPATFQQNVVDTAGTAGHDDDHLDLHRRYNETLSVTDHGAVGDNVADDTVAIQAAIDAASAGDAIFFPSGIYKVTATLTLPTDSLTLFGANVRNTQINGVGNFDVLQSSTQAVTARFDTHITNLRFVSDFNGGQVLDLTDCRETQLSRVWIDAGGTLARGISIFASSGIDVTNNFIENVYISGAGTSIDIATRGNHTIIVGGRLQPDNGVGIQISSANNISIFGTAIEFPGTVSIGVEVQNLADGVAIIGGRFESMATAIELDSGSDNIFIAGNFYSSNTTRLVNNSTGRLVDFDNTQQVYTPTNVTTDRSFDADTVLIAELADVVGTLIADLQTVGIVT